MMTIRRMSLIAVSLAALAGAAYVGASVWIRAAAAGAELPTAWVRRGALEVRVYTTGELRPSRVAMLVAPSVGGGLQIIAIKETGTLVDEGEAVIAFDPSEQEFILEQRRSELERVEQELIKARADAAVQTAVDRVALLKATYDVRRAELDVRRNEMLSGNEAKKNLLNLEEARRRLEQTEQDLQSHQTTGRADLTVLEEKRRKTLLSLQQAQQDIDRMEIRAPMRGIVVVKENRDASGGIFISGMSFPDYREGDQTGPGRLIAEVLDVEQMEIRSKVKEVDRGNLNPDLPVEISVDALPNRRFPGKLKSIAGLVARQLFDDSGRMFDATVDLNPHDFPLRPGVSARLVILSEHVREALLLPRQAVFEKNGEPVVFVKTEKGAEARGIRIVQQTESQVAVEGIEAGTEVMLVNPETRSRKFRGTASPLQTTSKGGAP